MNNTNRSNSLQYEAFMLGLYVFALVNVAVDSLFRLGSDVRACAAREVRSGRR